MTPSSAHFTPPLDSAPAFPVEEDVAELVVAVPVDEPELAVPVDELELAVPPTTFAAGCLVPPWTTDGATVFATFAAASLKAVMVLLVLAALFVG